MGKFIILLFSIRKQESSQNNKLNFHPTKLLFKGKLNTKLQKKVKNKIILEINEIQIRKTIEKKDQRRNKIFFIQI